MVTDFLAMCKEFNQPQSSGVKASHSGRQSYGDSAIGYAQVKREGNKCITRARICPEHKVRDKPYFVTCTIDEEQQIIKDVSCLSCVAALGGCKHSIAFLMWLHRRSEEPAPTQIVCYWKKPALSQVGSTEKSIKAKDIGKRSKKARLNNVDSPGFLEEVIEIIAENYTCPVKSHFTALDDVRQLSLHQMMISFINSNLNQTAETFMDFCKNSMNSEVVKKAATLSHAQSENSLWFELRYGRITASKLYEMSVCKTSSGSLVNQVIGVAKKFTSEAIKRGQNLEKEVLMTVRNKTGCKIQNSGFIILNEYGVIGASPDGVTEDAVFEIKCPISIKTFKRYINDKNQIPKKFLTQINVQMLATNVTKGYFCVAHPNFEDTKECTIIEVAYDEEFTKKTIDRALKFWKTHVFPKLYASFKE